MKKLTTIIAGSILAGTLAMTGCSENVTGLDPNYRFESITPNPFSAKASIEYEIGHLGEVNFGLYDVAGNKILNFHDDTVDVGINDHQFNAENLVSGTYNLLLEVDGIVYDSRKISKQ